MFFFVLHLFVSLQAAIKPDVIPLLANGSTYAQCLWIDFMAGSALLRLFI
jgi:hypothetical protein